MGKDNYAKIVAKSLRIELTLPDQKDLCTNSKRSRKIRGKVRDRAVERALVNRMREKGVGMRRRA